MVESSRIKENGINCFFLFCYPSFIFKYLIKKKKSNSKNTEFTIVGMWLLSLTSLQSFWERRTRRPHRVRSITLVKD